MSAFQAEDWGSIPHTRTNRPASKTNVLEAVAVGSGYGESKRASGEAGRKALRPLEATGQRVLTTNMRYEIFLLELAPIPQTKKPVLHGPTKIGEEFMTPRHHITPE
jgi:hypothetical protein